MLAEFELNDLIIAFLIVEIFYVAFHDVDTELMNVRFRIIN